MGMAEYLNKERFLSSMGLVGDETKYDNRDSEHYNRSYATWMGYEIMDSVDDSEEDDAVLVVRCKDCKYKSEKIHACTNVKFRGERIHIWVEPDDFCSYGERIDNDKN